MMMRIISLFFGFLFAGNCIAGSWVGSVADKAKGYYNNWVYGVESAGEYDFKACQKYAGGEEEESEYFAMCREGKLVDEPEMEKLASASNAIAVETLKSDFLDRLQSEVLRDVKKNYRELSALRQCLEKDLDSERCRKQKHGLLAGIRRDLPKLRALAAQKDMPGKIYSPTKPKRYDSSIEHSVSKVRPKELSAREESFMAKHTEELEENFRAKIIEEQGDEHNLAGCLEFRSCPSKEPIIDSHTTKMFERQNKKYAQAYNELASANPMLTLLKVRGDESEEEIFKDVERSLEFLSEKTQNAIADIENMEGDDRIDLMALGKGVEERLQKLDSRVYCDVAQDLKNEMEFDELKTDLLVGAGALLGGGVCAFTGGAGCVLAVAATAVGSEAVNLGLAQQRLGKSQNYFYSGQGDAQKVEQRKSEKALSMYLAPLALVGSGVGNGLKTVGRKIGSESAETASAAASASLPKTASRAVESAGRSRRLDDTQRRLIDDIEKELGGEKDRILAAVNPGNKFNLSKGDQTYLAGVVSLLKKKVKKENPDLSAKEIDELVENRARRLVNKCQEGK